MIIVVLGRAGSGKTAISQEICKLTTMPLVEVSSFLEKTAIKSTGKALPEEKHERRKILHNVKFKYEEQHGSGTFTDGLLWPEVREGLQSGSCVLSGIREPYLLHKITQEYSDVLVIGLEASPFVRYSRLCERDGYVSVERFEEMNEGDSILGLDITFSRSDEIIDAGRSLDQVTKDIHKILFKYNIKNKRPLTTWK